MSLCLKLQPKIQFNKSILTSCRRFGTKLELSATENEEYTKEPKYPPIQDLQYKAVKLRHRLQWQEKIKCLKTVEEKLFALNMPRYYGLKCVMLNDEKFRYNSLPFFQHNTRTLMNDSGLPEYYKDLDGKVDSLLPHVKGDIEDAILFEHLGYQTNDDKNADEHVIRRDKTSRLVSQINRVLMNGLIADCPHLAESEIDVDPRHEAFWLVGGIVPPIRIKLMRKKTWQREYADDPVNRNFQYVGKPLLTVRHQHPLESPMKFENFSPEEVSAVPEYRQDPVTMGYAYDHRAAVTVPGFWPGSRNEFGLLSYHSRDFINARNTHHGPEDFQENLHSQAIMASYAWLFGQACYQGFSTYHDPTYPLSTQTVITDGKQWSFYVYQLNTTRLDIDAIETNPKVNQCWGTKEMKLFEEIDDKGKLIGFNDDVLRNLMKFYLNEPKERDIVMKPYLGDDEQLVAHIEEDERRIFLESTYKHLCALRPRHRLVPEVYHWEKIYKIDHKTKPLAPRRRFFELGINPFARKLNEHPGQYIPKCVRVGGKKNRNKLMKTYYPCTYP